MSDLIRREDVLKAIYDALTYSNSGQSEFVQQRIRALPAVQPDREAALREAADLARDRHKGWTNFSEVECDFTACRDIADAILALIDKPAHVNETPKSEHEAGNMLTPATERSATMTDELVERLRDEAQDLHGMAWRNTYGGQETTMSATLASEAADRIEALTAERDGLLRCVTDNHVALCRAEAAEAERDEWKTRHFAMRDKHDARDIAAKNYAAFSNERRKRAEAAEAERDRLRAALIAERIDTLWNAYSTGMERDGRWRHMCMSDGEWLEHECGLDDSQRDHPADEVKAAIPLAAKRFVAALAAPEE